MKILFRFGLLVNHKKLPRGETWEKKRRTGENLA